MACYDGNILTYISTKDGLCGNAVVSIAEDQEGNIWFGTHNGVQNIMGKHLPIMGVIKASVGLAVTS